MPPFLRRPPNGGRESARRDDPPHQRAAVRVPRVLLLGTAPTTELVARAGRSSARFQHRYRFCCCFFFSKRETRKFTPAVLLSACALTVLLRQRNDLVFLELYFYCQVAFTRGRAVRALVLQRRSVELGTFFALDLLGYVSCEFFVVDGSSGWVGSAGAGFS